MPTIPLDRRFLGWSKELENTDPDAILPFGRSTDLSDWAEISERRRLVILAEAGAGKTEEMREQARWRIEAGQFAFFATVEDVAADGLEGALPIGDRRRLQDWRASNETAWFFLDSIDPRR